MGDQGPFGGAGGSRCVDDHGGVFRVNGRHPFIHTMGMGLQIRNPLIPEFIKKDDFRMGEAPQPFGVPDHHLFQGGFRKNLKDLIQLLFVLEEEDSGLRMVKDVVDALGCGGGIDPAGDTADGHGAQVAKQPFRAIVPQNGNEIARLCPQGEHPCSRFPDPLPILPPGDAVPDAILFAPQSFPFFLVFNLLKEEGGKGGRRTSHYHVLLFL